MEFNEEYNIILITLDGLRKDKIELSSSLKSIIKESIYFSNMITVSPYTLASLHAIFSGMYPSRNGVDAYYSMFKFKKDEIVTLPEILQTKGYYTCCDIISDVIIPKKGFNERNIFDESNIDFKKRHSELIQKLSEKKFFLYLHYTEIHKHLVMDVIQKHKEENDDTYFNSIKENDLRYSSYLPYLDSYVSTIMETLRNSKILDKTIVILHADHGTSIGEKKGEKFYGVFVYDYTVNVFTIIRIPNFASNKISHQCRTIDLFPTIAFFAGIDTKKIDNKVQGETLLPMIIGKETNDREVFVETGGLYGPWPSPKRHNVFCIRINDKKLIYNDTPQTWEFYNLKDDPCELNNIYEENFEILEMKKRLIYHLDKNKIITNLTPN